MSHFYLYLNIDSPRRICDALPLSSQREGKRPIKDVG